MFNEFFFNTLGALCCQVIVLLIFRWLLGYKICFENKKRVIIIISIYIVATVIMRVFLPKIDIYISLIPLILFATTFILKAYDFPTIMLLLCVLIYLYQSMFYFQWITEFIFSLLKLYLSQEIISSISSIAILIICLLIPKICNILEIDVQNNDQRYENWKGLLAIEGIVLLINLLIIESGLNILLNNDQFAAQLTFLLLVLISLFLNTISLFFYGIMRTNTLRKNLNHITQKYLEMQTMHYERLEQINLDIRKFKHDYNNHINILKMFLDQDLYKEAKDYINTIGSKKEVLKLKYSSGNSVVDAIINEKYLEYKDYDIQITVEGLLPNDIKITNFDLCTILGNLISNAFEACTEYRGERFIHFYFKRYNDFFNIIITNSSEERNTFKSTKGDLIHHGIGLNNVLECVKKYMGNLELSYDNNIVTANLIIKI